MEITNQERPGHRETRAHAASPGAMQLRTLQTIDGLGPTASNTVVIAVPIDLMDAVKAIAAKAAPKA